MNFDESLANAAANRALYDLVDRYGNAASLDLAAYDGKSGVVEQTKRSLLLRRIYFLHSHAA